MHGTRSDRKRRKLETAYTLSESEKSEAGKNQDESKMSPNSTGMYHDQLLVVGLHPKKVFLSNSFPFLPTFFSSSSLFLPSIFSFTSPLHAKSRCWSSQCPTCYSYFLVPFFRDMITTTGGISTNRLASFSSLSLLTFHLISLAAKWMRIAMMRGWWSWKKRKVGDGIPILRYFVACRFLPFILAQNLPTTWSGTIIVSWISLFSHFLM